MSLSSLEYIIKEDYSKDVYSHEEKSPSDKDVDNYFDLKTKYFTELLNFNQGKTKKITSMIYNDGENKPVTTNYPIIFRENEGNYIIDVINDEEPHNVLYSKKIGINKVVNVKHRLDEISKQIENNHFIIKKWNMFNKLEGLRRDKLETDILHTHDMINDAEKEKRSLLHENEIKELKVDYQRVKIENANLHIEYNILNEAIIKYIQYKLRHHSSYSIDLISENNKSKVLFDDIIKSISSSDIDKASLESKLLNYLRQERMINQTSKMLPNDIVLFTNEEDGSSDVGIIKSDLTSGPIEKVLIETSDRDLVEVLYSSVKPIKSLQELMSSLIIDIDNFTITYENYRELLLKSDPQLASLIPEYSRIIEVTDNSDGKLTKSNKINYFYQSKNVPEESSKQKLKLGIHKKSKSTPIKDLKLSINIVDDSLLYDNSDIFMFYSNSAASSPGKGTKEEITSGEEYTELKVTEDWRKKLSNFHIRKDTRDNIIPIIIDGIPFASVEHYFHFSKFWNVPHFTQSKKQQYNQYAMKFTFNYSGSDGWGRQDANKAKMMGSKKHGLEHRPDWFKPIKGIKKDKMSTLEQQKGGGNFITLRDYCLLKGVYAKFTQLNGLKKMLINTGNAKLIHPIGGSPRKNEYEVSFQVLYTRYLIKNNIKLFNYQNEEKDYELVENQIKTLLSTYYLEKRFSEKNILSDILEMLKDDIKFSVNWKRNEIKLFVKNLLAKNQDPLEYADTKPKLKAFMKEIEGIGADYKPNIPRTRSETDLVSLESEKPKLIRSQSDTTSSRRQQEKKITKDQHHSDINIAREKQKEIEMILKGQEQDTIAITEEKLSQSAEPLSSEIKQITTTYPQDLLADETKSIDSSGQVDLEIDEVEVIGSSGLPIKPISKLQVDDFGSSKDQLQLPEQEESEELVESYQDEAKPDINVTDEEMEEEVINTNIEEESLSKIQIDNFGTAEPKIEISGVESIAQTEDKPTPQIKEIKLVEDGHGQEELEESEDVQELVEGEEESETQQPIETGIPRTYSEDIAVAKKESIESGKKLHEEIENLHQFIEQSNKNIFNVPPDGDCGYYSIVEIMAINNISPLNFKETEELQYSRERERKKVSIVEEDQYSSVLYNAMLELRRDVSLKFKSNIKYDEVQTDSLESIKSIIAADKGSDIYTKDIHDAYIRSIERSANSDLNPGSWISDIELGIISALFNINIKVYYSNKTVRTYEALKYSELYPNPPTMNLGATPQTIEIGYYSNFHYVGVINREIEQSKLEALKYYVVTLEIGDSEMYEVAFDLNIIGEGETEVIPLGIYNQQTHKIKYFSYTKSELDRKLGEAFSNFKSKNEINEETVEKEGLFTPIYYFKDISSGKVFKESDLKSEILGVVKVKQLKGGRTYSKIKFN